MKDEDEFYYANKLDKNNNSYRYRIPKCKECYKAVERIWINNNPDKIKAKNNRRNKLSSTKKSKREVSRKRREDGTFAKWQHSNKNRIKQYNDNRRHKIHDIAQEEWNECKEFFNYQCAYCGMSEKEHKERYKQQLHKEHVDHEGSNKIDNCVPACRVCNSEKTTHTLEEWYSIENPKFDVNKLNKIHKWLEMKSK